MARYRKIDVRIWNDQKFRSFSDDAKLIFLFILTHPELTQLGVMRATIGGLAEELRWDRKRFAKRFAELLSKRLIEHDQTASCLVIPNFLKYNPPDNGNVIKHCLDMVDLVPECALKTQALERLKPFIERFNIPLPERFNIPYANPEAETEAETINSNRIRGEGPRPPDFDKFWAAYPRKTGKRDAEAAWRRAVDRMTTLERDRPAAVAMIQQAAEEFSQSPKGKSGEFCPYPATWLNQDRWEDDRQEWQRKDERNGRHKPSERAGAGQVYSGPPVDAPRRHSQQATDA